MIHIPWLVSYPRREGISDMHSYVYQWIIPDSIRHNNVKYARWGTNYLYKIHQPPQEIQTEFEAANS